MSPEKLAEIRKLTDVVIALEDENIVRLYGTPTGQCPYPSDVARALYDHGARVAASRPLQEAPAGEVEKLAALLLEARAQTTYIADAPGPNWHVKLASWLLSRRALVQERGAPDTLEREHDNGGYKCPA